MGNPMLTRLMEVGPFRQTLSFPRRRDGFHVMATSAGFETAQGPAYDWSGRSRGNTPFSVLQHCVAGAGRLVYERREFRVGPGETMLVSIPHAHRYWLQAGESWSFFWIAMSGQEALRLNRAILHAAGPVFRLRGETVETLAGICLSLCRPKTTAGHASSEAYRAIMALHDDLMVRTDDQTGSAGAHLAIDRAVAHALAHLDATLDVAGLAAVADLSRAHFVRLFTRFKGMPPSEFVLRERMSRAARLLVNAQLSVKEISTACGFGDPNYFAKVFRRTYAISPSDFRTTGMYSTSSNTPPAKQPEPERG